MTIGDRIRLRRKELGLTQNELAEKMGYTSRTSICTVEKNKEDLTTTRVSKFAEALETTPSYLMGWTDNPKKNTEIVSEINDYEVRLSNYALRYLEIFKPKPHSSNTFNCKPDPVIELLQKLDERPEIQEFLNVAFNSKPENIIMATELLQRMN